MSPGTGTGYLEIYSVGPRQASNSHNSYSSSSSNHTSHTDGNYPSYYI